MDTRDAGKIRPADQAEVVDVSSTDHPITLAGSTSAIYVGGAGVLEVNMEKGKAGVLFTCPAGTLLPIQVTKILNANTTATLIVALY